MILAEKKKKVEKPKKVEEKRVEFDDKKSYSLVESLFDTSKMTQPTEETESSSVAYFQPQSEIEGQYTPEPLSCEKQMALPYLQMSDPVRDAIPKVSSKLQTKSSLKHKRKGSMLAQVERY